MILIVIELIDFEYVGYIYTYMLIDLVDDLIIYIYIYEVELLLIISS